MPSWAPSDGGGGGSGTSSGSGSVGGAGANRGGGATAGGLGAGAPSAGPATAGPTPTGRRGGIALDFRRGSSARELLQIDWQYPVHVPAEVDPTGNTVVKPVRRALPLEQAYALCAAGDPRPLLILRECVLCKGSDHALLSRTLDNEQTALLTHWFRCVKLAPPVLDADDPFHALFAAVDGEEHVPHLFFADPDGSHRVPLPGDQTQQDLWEVMSGFLERRYEGNAKAAVKQMRGLLSQFDELDAEEQELLPRIDAELERSGEDSSRMRKYRAQQQTLEGERQKLRDKAQQIRDLALIELQAAEPAGR